MAVQVANFPQQQQQQLWYAAPSPTYPPTQRNSGRMSSMSVQQQQRASQRVSTQQQLQRQQYQRASVITQEDDAAWGGEYVGYRFEKPEIATKQQQQQQQQIQEAQEETSEESSGASTPESRGSSGWSSSTDANNGMLAPKGNRKALRKLTRLVKKRGQEIAVITVFNAEGVILCSLNGAQAGQEHIYEPTSDEGKYLRLALERGFKKQGCEFDFGGTLWLSGQQEEIDDKQTMLGNESTQEFLHHRFYTVLSPTGRYVVAAVLKEGTGGQLNAKLLRKIRTTADNFEVYEAWAGSGKFMAKLACAA